MAIKSIDLAWIVVKDLKKAVHFYTEILGLQLRECHEEFGWAELQGHDGGALLGIAQASAHQPDLRPGENAFVTFSVEDLEASKNEMMQRGVQCIGDVQEVPEHVKMQMIIDADGNRFQLVQVLSKSTE